MSDTKQDILKLGEHLIRLRGYNAFSYQDISVQLGIKNAAIHYYFPKKSDLAVQIIRQVHDSLYKLKQDHLQDDPISQLKLIIEIYARSHREDKVCLMGAFASEFYSLDQCIQEELRKVAIDVKRALTEILIKGRQERFFHFSEEPEVKAVLIITNLLAALQLERITGKDEFTTIQQAILNNLTSPTH